MTVQAGLCQTWSEPKLLFFSRTGSYNYGCAVVSFAKYLLSHSRRRSRWLLGTNAKDLFSKFAIVLFNISVDGNDMNPALPDTSMKLGRYVYKHELLKFSR